ncbi:MAG: hypothetical protein WBI23_10905 [Methanothrix sp.]
MADQARQSFFQLENITAALDSKVFGMVTADALLFSVFAYISQPLSDALFYIPMALIVLSFISLLVSAWPRHFHRQFADDIIKNYGTWEPNKALAQIAANYADLELNQYKIYNNKLIWFMAGLVLMIIAMISEMIVFSYVTVNP